MSVFALDKANATNSLDPVQKLFLDKIKDYKMKSKKLEEGKLVDTTPEFDIKIKKETEGLRRRFGEGNMEEFPKFDFQRK